MKGVRSRLTIIATVLLTALVMQNRGGSAFAATATGANTVITNSATGSYVDSRGATYEIDSNPVSIIVQGVASLSVSPKENVCNPAIDGFPAGSAVTKTFVISNTSNIQDAYRITTFTADRGTVTSLSYVTPGGPVPIVTGSTMSPNVLPGGSITVQAVINTSGIPVGTTFALHLTAQTTAVGTANGLQSDSGEQWLVSATAPTLAGPSSPNTLITKTVNQTQVVQTQGGAVVHFDIAGKNYGGVPATNVMMTDALPDGIAADLSTVKLNGAPVTNASVSGQTLTVPIGTLNAGATADVSFDSQVANIASIGTAFVNVAAMSADGISPVSTTPAVVFIGTADIVFDPAAGNSPVQGATVSLLDANNQLVPLSSPAGTQDRARAPFASRSASLNTQNPLITGSDGTYGFALQTSQISGASGKTFYITISAHGYLNRRIKMLVMPSAMTGLYSVSASSQDGQPIAKAGTYELTTGTVALNNIFGLFGNLPMFKSQSIAIDKIADRSTAQPGDRISYTVTLSNPSGGNLDEATVTDTLPAGSVYASGSASIDGKLQEPSVDGRVLTWHTGMLAPGAQHVLRYSTIVYPNVPAGTILTNTASAGATISGTHVNVNASANAQVQIEQGALSDRIVITGRVFADVMHTGRFTRGDRGLSGARVFMEDGTSALTDTQGRFSFPGARPGMHVLRVDPSTLPDHSGGTLQRLVHGILDDGLMQDVEFAVSVP